MAHLVAGRFSTAIGKKTQFTRGNQSRDQKTADLTSNIYKDEFWFTVCSHTGLLIVHFENRPSVALGSVCRHTGRWQPKTKTIVDSIVLKRALTWLQSERVNKWIHGVYLHRSPMREHSKPTPKQKIKVPQLPDPSPAIVRDAYKRRVAKRA